VRPRKAPQFWGRSADCPDVPIVKRHGRVVALHECPCISTLRPGQLTHTGEKDANFNMIAMMALVAFWVLFRGIHQALYISGEHPDTASSGGEDWRSVRRILSGLLAPLARMLDWIETSGKIRYFRNIKIVREAYVLVASQAQREGKKIEALGK
jgi:hypothetical protein